MNKKILILTVGMFLIVLAPAVFAPNNTSDYEGWYNITGMIGETFESSLLGSKALMGIFLLGFMGYLGARGNVEFGIFGVIILAPLVAVLARYGYFGDAAWVEGLVYMAIALIIGLAFWRVYSGE